MRKECRCGKKRDLTIIYYLGGLEYRCTKCLEEQWAG